MKNKLLSISILLLLVSTVFAQVDEAGYRFMKRIRGLQVPNSRVEEIVLDESHENLIIGYRAKQVYYISIYKLYSWDNIKEYRIDGGVELYNSYFSEDGNMFYANTDIYKQLFVEINLKTDAMKDVQCAETPKGCRQVEPRMYSVKEYTADKYWLIQIDKEHDNDIVIYFDQVQFNQIKAELEEALQRDVFTREVKETMENEARENQKVGVAAVKKQPKPETTTKSPKIELSVKDVMSLIETGKLTIQGTEVKISKEAQDKLKNPIVISALKGQNIPEKTNNQSAKNYSVGEVIQLNNIQFEQGKSEISASSFSELDNLVDILNEKISMKIEVQGHTNNIGVKNLEISEQRAKAVADYLVSKGIDSTRVTFKGFGDTKPIASNDTEEGQAKNRRVEFLIISQ